MDTLLKLIIMILLTAICIQQTFYLNADWCSSEIDILRKNVSEIHTVLIGDQEVSQQMNCWSCGHELIWGGDHDTEWEENEDEQHMIMTNLSCPECTAEVIVYHGNKEQMYIHIARVKDFMRENGIERGFEQDTIRKKRQRGQFNVPHIRIGNTPYFKDEDILKWLKEQSRG